MTDAKIWNLTGKVAVITGAAGLLGPSHASALLDLDCTVVLTDIDAERLEQTTETLKKKYSENIISSYELDVTDESSVISTAEKIIEDFGVVDILINNAAIDPAVGSSILSKSSRFEDFDLEDWKYQESVGLGGAVLCSKVFGSAMAKMGGGIILNISSDLSVISPDHRVYNADDVDENDKIFKPISYSLVKTALIGLTRYLATYWADKNIRVNALSPGGVYNNQDPFFVTRLEARIPMGRMASIDEYRGCVQFLCSDASRYVTGQNLVADGGRSLW